MPVKRVCGGVEAAIALSERARRVALEVVVRHVANRVDTHDQPWPRWWRLCDDVRRSEQAGVAGNCAASRSRASSIALGSTTPHAGREADGDIYCLSWLIICPARPPGELFGGSDELGDAVLDC